jgi:integrase
LGGSRKLGFLSSERESPMRPYPYTRRYYDRGKWRIDYRRHGKTVQLKGEMGTAEFQQSYDAAKAVIAERLTAAPSLKPSLEKPKPGSFRWLVTEYLKSSTFRTRLDANTQAERRRLLEDCLMERATNDKTKTGHNFRFADYLAEDLTEKHIRVLRDRKQHVPNAANNRLKALRGLFKWAKETNQIATNPCNGVPKLEIETDGHRPWTEAEREQYKARHPMGTMARLAYELFYGTGQRRGDVWSFGPHNIIRDKLVFRQEKNQRRKPADLELEIVPDLRTALDATPNIGMAKFLVSELGEPFASKASFANWFKERCQEANLPADCTPHGLRKAAATFYAEMGASASELCAIFGWRSLRSAEIYVRAASQKKLASQVMARAHQMHR